MHHAHRLSVCAEGEIDAFISSESLAWRLLASWLAQTLQRAQDERRCTERSCERSILTSGRIAPCSEIRRLLVSLRIEHSESAPADCDCANVSTAYKSAMRCGDRARVSHALLVLVVIDAERPERAGCLRSRRLVV